MRMSAGRLVQMKTERRKPRDLPGGRGLHLVRVEEKVDRGGIDAEGEGLEEGDVVSH